MNPEMYRAGLEPVARLLFENTDQSRAPFDWTLLYDLAAFATVCLTPGDSRVAHYSRADPSAIADGMLMKNNVRSAAELVEAKKDNLFIRMLSQGANTASKLTDAATVTSYLRAHNADRHVDSAMPAFQAEAAQTEANSMSAIRAAEQAQWSYYDAHDTIPELVAEIVRLHGHDWGAFHAIIGSLCRWILSKPHSLAVCGLILTSEALSARADDHAQSAHLAPIIMAAADWKSRAPTTNAIIRIMNLPAPQPAPRTVSAAEEAENGVWYELRYQLMICFLAFSGEHRLTPAHPSVDRLVRSMVWTNQTARMFVVRHLEEQISSAIGVDDAFLLAVAVKLLAGWAAQPEIPALFAARYKTRRDLNEARLTLLKHYFAIPADEADQEQFHHRRRWIERIRNEPCADKIMNGRMASRSLPRALRQLFARSMLEDYYPVVTDTQLYLFRFMASRL